MTEPNNTTPVSYWRRYGVRLAIVFFSALWLLLMAVTWADDADAAETPPNSGDEYSFNWLDPDKKIYVLQNRRYTKARRLLLSALVGTSAAGAYRETFTVEPRAAYYFSEWLGIELFYTKLLNRENTAFEALQKASGSAAIPVVREVRSQLGALVHYVPWYAKINVFNQILYFDWYFAGGAGSLGTALDTRPNANAAASYQEEQLMGYFLGTGHQYHLNHTLTVRLDFTSTFYRAPIFGSSGESTWFSNYTFGAGLGIRI